MTLGGSFWSALLTLAVTLALLAFARHLRGRKRLALSRSAIISATFAFTWTVLAAANRLDVSFSDGLGIAGMAMSVAFGFGGATLDRAFRKVIVAVVIPSRAPFHTELRAGLADGLASTNAVLRDEYLQDSSGIENLAQFFPLARRALDVDPDYMVIASPGWEYLSDTSLLDDLNRLGKRGGGIFFIENSPAEAVRRAATIRSHSNGGAAAVTGWLADQVEMTDRIAVFAGPEGSHPAQVRREFILNSIGLPPDNVSIMTTGDWSAAGASDSVEELNKDERGLPDFIICGNDSMAIGVSRTLIALGRTDVRVIGYDGIPQAIFRVSHPLDPMVATVRIPPSQYGVEVASQIRDDLGGPLGRSRLHSVTIPISSANLVTSYNAAQILPA